MRTTWNRAVIAGALAASGLPALMSTPASAQGFAGGMTAPTPGGTTYPSPSTNIAASPYTPVNSPYSAGMNQPGGMAGAPGSGSSLGGGVPRQGGTMAQAAASYYGARANTAPATPAAMPPYGSAEYAPSGRPYAPATAPSPFLPTASGPAAAPGYGPAAAPGYGTASSPYASGAAGLGGRAVAPSSMTNYSQVAPAMGRGVVLGGNGVELGAGGSSDPSGMRASYANPSAYANPGAAAPSAADRTAPAARGSAFAPDTMPYAPPPKPSRLRRFYNWITGDDKATDRPVHAYIDPSTGRTDLPLSKPWLKQVW